MSMPSSSEPVATMARSSPDFQAFLDIQADLPRQRAVVRVGQRRERAVVDFQRDLFRQSAGVGEKQRGAVGVHAITKGIAQWLPDFVAGFMRGKRPFGYGYLEIDDLLAGRGDGADRPGRAVASYPATVRATALSGRTVADSAMRCTSPARSHSRSSAANSCTPRRLSTSA